MMQRKISNKVFLGNTVFRYNNVGRSSAIDRTVSNYNDAKEKVKKKENLTVHGDMTRTPRNTSLGC